jgi:hypothetical protein
MVPMNAKWLLTGASVALFSVAACPAYCGTDAAKSENAGTAGVVTAQQIARLVPGRSTKAEIQSSLGAPWRVVQFNDCGEAMGDQADETWEYRGADANGGYRLHVEFDDHDTVHLLAKIPDKIPGGKATAAKIAPAEPAKGMSMPAGMSM